MPARRNPQLDSAEFHSPLEGESAKQEPVLGLTGERQLAGELVGGTNHSPAPDSVIPAEAGIHNTIINPIRNGIPPVVLPDRHRGLPGRP